MAVDHAVDVMLRLILFLTPFAHRGGHAQKGKDEGRVVARGDYKRIAAPKVHL